MGLHAMTSCTKQALLCVIILLLGLVLIDRMFPRKTEIDPVQKEAKKLESDSKKSEVINSDEIKPIGDIPTISIGVQSDKQPAEQNAGELIGDYQIPRIRYTDVELVYKEVEREPAEDYHYNAQALDYCDPDTYLIKKFNNPNTEFICETYPNGQPIKWQELRQ